MAEKRRNIKKSCSPIFFWIVAIVKENVFVGYGVQMIRLIWMMLLFSLDRDIYIEIICEEMNFVLNKNVAIFSLKRQNVWFEDRNVCTWLIGMVKSSSMMRYNYFKNVVLLVELVFDFICCLSLILIICSLFCFFVYLLILHEFESLSKLELFLQWNSFLKIFLHHQ